MNRILLKLMRRGPLTGTLANSLGRRMMEFSEFEVPLYTAGVFKCNTKPYFPRAVVISEYLLSAFKVQPC